MSEEFPVFDDEWVEQARHRELSVLELERSRRADAWSKRRGRIRRLIVRAGIVAAVALVGVVIAISWNLSGPESSTGDLFDEPRTRSTQVTSAKSPTPVSGAGERLHPEVLPETDSNSFAFLNMSPSGAPITYDPCRPVRFVVNRSLAPAGHGQIIGDALVEMAAATGLDLSLVGSTSEPASTQRPLFQPERYGDQWAPILIAWADDAAVPDLVGETVGVAGSGWVSSIDGEGWYVSGTLYVDLDSSDEPEDVYAVLLHELGHVLGLDHVTDPTQIMNPTQTVVELGAGDRAGLARLGSGVCAGEL